MLTHDLSFSYSKMIHPNGYDPNLPKNLKIDNFYWYEILRTATTWITSPPWQGVLLSCGVFTYSHLPFTLLFCKFVSLFKLRYIIIPNGNLAVSGRKKKAFWEVENLFKL